jgi:hypothetical protein
MTITTASAHCTICFPKLRFGFARANIPGENPGYYCVERRENNGARFICKCQLFPNAKEICRQKKLLEDSRCETTICTERRRLIRNI